MDTITCSVPGFALVGGRLTTEAGVDERRLLSRLFHERHYNRLERPVFNESQPLAVRFGLVLQQIIDVVSNLLLPTQ